MTDPVVLKVILKHEQLSSWSQFSMHSECTRSLCKWNVIISCAAVEMANWSEKRAWRLEFTGNFKALYFWNRPEITEEEACITDGPFFHCHGCCMELLSHNSFNLGSECRQSRLCFFSEKNSCHSFMYDSSCGFFLMPSYIKEHSSFQQHCSLTYKKDHTWATH